ncbi:MAG TPA: Fe-S-containing protein [Thermoanaerobaculia bacterium]|nr:Fe-S-containing protein [Thermoanaerobaculia bacterium]
MRIRPIHAIFVVAFFMGAVLLAEWAIDKHNGRGEGERVMPKDGVVKVDVAGIAPGQVRFYDFLNPGNQEVRFLVARDRAGTLQVAFDAAENDYKRKLGFRQEGDWLVNNKCETSVRLEEVNAGTSGCRPQPLRHRVEGQTLVLAEADVLAGWRYFH